MPNDLLTEDRILREQPRLGLDDTFQFKCDATLDCFTHCCRDVAIVLTPYDILRMKRALGMDSSEFLSQHTIAPFTPEQKFPVVLLKMDSESRRCPFVGAEGCGIYPHRPWSCRMYPLGVAEPKSPTPTERAFHFLVKEEICHGHGQGAPCSVREWIRSQGIEEYEMMGASFRDLTLHDFWDSGQSLTPEQMEMFHMACYDLDRFRRFVFETRFLELLDIDEARVEAIRSDDVELLDLAMQWLRFSLFREKTMKVKRSAWEARKR